MTIEFKQLGQNIILTIEGEQLSKRFADKKPREAVKTAVNEYNALPKSKQTKKGLKAIKEMMDKEASAPAKAAKKPAKKAPVKATKKAPTKAKAEKKPVASKKTAPKKATSTDQAIGFRQLGQNIILTIGKEETSKRFSEKSDREKVKSLVYEYNDLPKSKKTKTKLKAIQAMMVKSATLTKTKASKEKVEKKATVKQKSISGKQMGQNIILVIDGEKHSKRITDKEDRTIVLGLVQTYNKKNTKSALDKILKLMKKDEKPTEDKVDKEVKKLAKSKDAPKAASKLTKEEEIANAKKLLEDNGMEVKKKTASSSRTPSRRRGEH